MTTKPLVIWGASGHARVVADIVRLRGEYEIAGFIDSLEPTRVGDPFLGSTILGGEERLERLKQSGLDHFLIAVGDCAARLDLAQLALARGFQLATAVHPDAVIASDVVIGPGTVIAAGAVVNPGAAIGANVIINTSASVDHECLIEDGAHIGPGVRLGGRVDVGRGAWIGIGATVIDRIAIGAGCIVGAGSVVVEHLPDGVLAFGVPARVQRKLAAVE